MRDGLQAAQHRTGAHNQAIGPTNQWEGADGFRDERQPRVGGNRPQRFSKCVRLSCGYRVARSQALSSPIKGSVFRTNFVLVASC